MEIYRDENIRVTVVNWEYGADTRHVALTLIVKEYDAEGWLQIC